MTTLREHLNLDANDELHMFLQSTKKKTAQMKYDEFVKHALPHFRIVMTNYLKNVVEPQFRECVTVKALEELVIPALAPSVMEEIMLYIDKQKGFNMVERTYIALDLVRSISSEIGKQVGIIAMHYANAIRAAPKIVQANGKSY